MKKLFHSILKALCVLVTIVYIAPIAHAQDPVKVDPDHYKVLYETRSVRILEYNDSPGHKVPKHSHPNYFVYVVSDATRLFTDWTPVTACNENGTTAVLKADEKLIKSPTTHCEENTGYTDTRLILVEFKNGTRARRSHKSKRQHSRRTSTLQNALLTHLADEPKIRPVNE